MVSWSLLTWGYWRASNNYDAFTMESVSSPPDNRAFRSDMASWSSLIHHKCSGVIALASISMNGSSEITIICAVFWLASLTGSPSPFLNFTCKERESHVWNHAHPWPFWPWFDTTIIMRPRLTYYLMALYRARVGVWQHSYQTRATERESLGTRLDFGSEQLPCTSYGIVGT